MAQSFFPLAPVDVTPGTTGSYQEVNVSAHAPVGATGVLLHIDNTDGALREFSLRKKGSGDDRYYKAYTTAHLWAAIGVDGDRIFEAKIVTSGVHIWLVGYTMAGVTFLTNGVEKNPDQLTQWRDIDWSVEAPNAIGVILEIVNPHSSHHEFGVRKNGSGDDRHVDLGQTNHCWAIIGCDDAQIIEEYHETTDIHFYLVGYITDGAIFNLNATDLSLVAIDDWLDLSALPSLSNIGFIEVIGSFQSYGLRKDGSAENIYALSTCHPWAFVECASLIIEGQISNVSVDFFLVGYATAAAPTGIQDKSANMGVKMIAGKLI